MTDPAADAARSAALNLVPELGPNLPADVEIALAARNAQQRPGQYLDPVSLAGLIVAIATLAWTIYNDQRDRNPEPPPGSTIARQVRIILREQDADLPAASEHITEVIAAEIIRQDFPPRYPHDGSAPPTSSHHRGAGFNTPPNGPQPGHEPS